MQNLLLEGGMPYQLSEAATGEVLVGSPGLPFKERAAPMLSAPRCAGRFWVLLLTQVGLIWVKTTTTITTTTTYI